CFIIFFLAVLATTDLYSLSYTTLFRSRLAAVVLRLVVRLRTSLRMRHSKHFAARQKLYRYRQSFWQHVLFSTFLDRLQSEFSCRQRSCHHILSAAFL